MKDTCTSCEHLQPTSTDVQQGEELCDYNESNWGLKESYCPKATFHFIFELQDWDKEYKRLSIDGQLINNLIYHKVLCNCCLSNNFMLKLGLNLKILLTEMSEDMEKKNAEYIVRLAKEIPASFVLARYAQLLSIILRLWKIPKRMNKWRERRIVGKNWVVVLM